MADHFAVVTRGRGCLTEVLKTSAKAGEVRKRRQALTVLLLLASILSISELAKTGPYFGLSTLTQRVLSLNRMGEPSADRAGVPVVAIAQPIIGESHPNAADLEPAYPATEILTPSLVHTRSANPFRSPPPRA